MNKSKNDMKGFDDMEFITLSRDYDYPIRAMLNMIRSEVDRMYWNKNQEVMLSPFDNTGAPEFKTDVFAVRSYDWGGNEAPNFETDKLQIWWYKHSNRGIYAKVLNDGSNVAELLFHTLTDAIKSAQRHFGEKPI